MEGDDILYAEKFSTNKDDDIFLRAGEIANRLITVANDFEVEYIAIEGLAFSKRGNATKHSQEGCDRKRKSR